MNNKYEAFMDIQVPLDVLSIAMNGLLQRQGAVTMVQTDYHINVASDINPGNGTELADLKANFFNHMESIHIHFEPVNPGYTRMYYTIFKKSPMPGVIGFSIFDIIMGLVMGLIFGTLDSTFSILGFLLAFLLTILIFLFLPLMCWTNQKDKVHQKRLVKFFMPRLDSYIQIVMKNRMMR